MSAISIAGAIVASTLSGMAAGYGFDNGDYNGDYIYNYSISYNQTSSNSSSCMIFHLYIILIPTLEISLANISEFSESNFDVLFLGWMIYIDR